MRVDKALNAPRQQSNLLVAAAMRRHAYMPAGVDHVQTLLILGTQKAVDAFRYSGKGGTLVLVRPSVRSCVPSPEQPRSTCLHRASRHQRGAIMQ